ncbi:hypothetical protein HYZ70_02020 [Candidatus Curtissbacteria bacterium]|nr:hypothetical protein [Candidatus Curtissbacteria bacterium]
MAEEDEDWSDVDVPETKIPWFITVPFWILIGVLVFIASVLTQIRNNLRDINDATHYTSASADYLKDIQGIIEEIRDK